MTATAPRVIASGTIARLREKQLDDAERDYGWRTDPELATFDAVPPLSLTFSTFRSTLSEEIEFPSPYRRTLAIETVDGDRHIGNVMYYGYHSGRREAELGITIGDRDYWARGYGSEAVWLMLRYLFEELSLERVFLHTLTWNERAQRAFERAGLRAVRTVKRGGHEFVRMEMTRDEYVEAVSRRDGH